ASPVASLPASPAGGGGGAGGGCGPGCGFGGGTLPSPPLLPGVCDDDASPAPSNASKSFEHARATDIAPSAKSTWPVRRIAADRTTRGDPCTLHRCDMVALLLRDCHGE